MRSSDDVDIERAWATKVLERRRRLGFSQAQLAELAGMTQQAVSAIETGSVSPRITTARRIAVALRTDLESLFPGSLAESAGFNDDLPV